MRNGAYISASLHVVFIALAYFGLPALFNSDPVPNQPVYVEVVNLADQPIAQKSKPKPKPKPKPKAKLKPPPPPPPPPPEIEAPKAEPVPVAKPKPKPKVKAKPKPKKVAPKKTRLAKAAPKPRRKPKPPKRADPLKSLLRDLQKQPKKAVEPKKLQKKDKLKDMLASVARPPTPKAENMSPIDRRREARALAQLVMRQVSPCWTIPGGAKDAHTIRVGVRIYLHPDGTLSSRPKVEDQARMSRDAAFRAVAESALRALQNPRCTPLRLPIKKYAAWREISFNFDPRELLR